MTERTNPMNCPTSDEDTFQLIPERTLFTSGKVVVSAICYLVLILFSISISIWPRTASFFFGFSNEGFSHNTFIPWGSFVTRCQVA